MRQQPKPFGSGQMHILVPETETQLSSYAAGRPVPKILFPVQALCESLFLAWLCSCKSYLTSFD